MLLPRWNRFVRWKRSIASRDMAITTRALLSYSPLKTSGPANARYIYRLSICHSIKHIVGMQLKIVPYFPYLLLFPATHARKYPFSWFIFVWKSWLLFIRSQRRRAIIVQSRSAADVISSPLRDAEKYKRTNNIRDGYTSIVPYYRDICAKLSEIVRKSRV